jgi:hypothetical protein
VLLFPPYICSPILILWLTCCRSLLYS